MSIPEAKCKNCEKTYYGWSLLYGVQECEECGQKLETERQSFSSFGDVYNYYLFTKASLEGVKCVLPSDTRGMAKKAG